MEVVAAARARGLSFDGGIVLGAGAYGVVRRGAWGDSRTPCAVKSAVCAHGERSLEREVGLLCGVSHPHICGLLLSLIHI